MYWGGGRGRLGGFGLMYKRGCGASKALLVLCLLNVEPASQTRDHICCFCWEWTSSLGAKYQKAASFLTRLTQKVARV